MSHWTATRAEFARQLSEANAARRAADPADPADDPEYLWR